METNQEIILLKESFLEFISKVLPILPGQVLELFNSKWIPLKKLLSDPQKNASEIFILVSSMSQLKKSNSSFISTNSPNSDCSIQNKQIVVGQSVKSKELIDLKKEITKVKEQANPLYYKELKIEINKNFFLNTPRARPTSQQDLECTSNIQGYEEDIKAKILRDDIKFLNELRNATPEKRIPVSITLNLDSKIQNAILQFKKNNSILKTVHERSSEVTTPQSPKNINYESPLIYLQKPMYQYIQNPIIKEQINNGGLKGYSIYSKNGIVQPIQFDNQFQMIVQQYKNNFIYKKLYF
ncbi:unnamed protein product [Paramecium sonneborni]|uniref:Uncharacterized protein n=1 Tax=Paramecium sonneborni TaxID=65129 RepID=A0A8S1M7F9_9CILI|nr:unnamed protein product [Paramecium sonneborni]CAD8073773.1 unnamed protein product [Paramecium sonneborni]